MATQQVVKFIGVDLVNFIQVNSSMTLSLPSIEWPESFTTLSQTMRDTFGVDFFTQLGSLDCWLETNYCARALNAMLAYTGFVAAFPLYMAWVRCRGRMERDARDGLWDVATKYHAVIGVFLHTPLTNVVLQTLKCEQFDEYNVLEVDRSITCGTHTTCLVTAGIYIPLFTICFPAALVWAMREAFTQAGQAKLRSECTEEEVKKIVGRHKARYSFFTAKYEDYYWWYEVFEMMRKLMLTSVGSLIVAGSYSQILTKIAISMFFIGFFIRHSPFKATEADIMSLVSQSCTLFTLFYALCILTGFFEHEGIPPSAVAVVLVFIQLTPVVCAFIIVGWLVYAIWGDVAQDKMDQSIVAARRIKRSTTSVGSTLRASTAASASRTTRVTMRTLSRHQGAQYGADDQGPPHAGPQESPRTANWPEVRVDASQGQGAPPNTRRWRTWRSGESHV